MIPAQTRTSIKMLFRDHVSYTNVKHLNATFWKNVHDSWCSHLSEESKESYDLSNHTKVPILKRGRNSTNVLLMEYLVYLVC